MTASLELFDTLLFVVLFIDPPNEVLEVSLLFTVLLANTVSIAPFIPPPTKPPPAMPALAPAIAPAAIPADASNAIAAPIPAPTNTPPKVITPAKTVVATLVTLPVLLLSLYPLVWLLFSVKFMPSA